MTPLGPGELQARRRPGVILAIAAFRLLAGFCLAWPLTSVLAATGIGQQQDGDRVLFEGGSYMLLEILRLQGQSLSALVTGLVPVLALGLVLTVMCNAALLVALNVRERLALKTWLPAALERVPSLIALAAGVLLSQAMLLGAAALLADAVPDWSARPVASTALTVAIWSIALLLAGALGGYSDIAKASVVRSQARLLGALGQALDCLRRSPIRTCFGWLPYALLFLAALVAASQLVERLDVSRPGTWRVAMVFALHQLVIVFGIALRAAWFARALRLSATEA